jgi:hypothetical protein
MDTDDLSEEAYEAVIVESGRFHTDLRLQFGLLSGECADENEFLEECMKLINELRQLELEYLSDLFFDEVPDLAELRKSLDLIARNIEKVKCIPLEKRRFGSDFPLYT